MLGLSIFTIIVLLVMIYSEVKRPTDNNKNNRMGRR